MSVDWHEVFVPKDFPFELVLRGTVMYLVLLALLRFLVRRHLGAMNLSDLLVLVLIAEFRGCALQLFPSPGFPAGRAIYTLVSLPAPLKSMYKALSKTATPGAALVLIAGSSFRGSLFQDPPSRMLPPAGCAT